MRNREADLELTINDGKTTDPRILTTAMAILRSSRMTSRPLTGRIAGLGHAPHDIKQFNREGKKFARFYFVADPGGCQAEALERYGWFD